jgi:hypothetical protein
MWKVLFLFTQCSVCGFVGQKHCDSQEGGGNGGGGKGGEGRVGREGGDGEGGVPPVDYTVETDTPAHPHHEGQLARKMDGSVVYLFQFSAVS